MRFSGASHAPSSRGPRCRSRWPRASAPQLCCSGALWTGPRCRSYRLRTAHSRLAQAPRTAPSLFLPMRPALSSRVVAALPAPPILSLAHPALSSRVSAAHFTRPFLSLAHPAPTLLSPRDHFCRSCIPWERGHQNQAAGALRPRSRGVSRTPTKSNQTELCALGAGWGRIANLLYNPSAHWVLG